MNIWVQLLLGFVIIPVLAIVVPAFLRKVAARFEDQE